MNHIFSQIHLPEQFAKMETKEWAYLQILAPNWIFNDPLIKQLHQLPELYQQGKIVLAAIVQANRILFSEEHAYSSAAEIVYDPKGIASAAELQAAAHQLYKLKNTTPDDPELAEFAAHITDEYDRKAFDVPNKISPLGLKTSIMLVWRLHLPDGVLRQNIVPILVYDDVQTILPARFWQQTDLYQEWISGSQMDMSAAFYQLNQGGLFWEQGGLLRWLGVGKNKKLFPQKQQLQHFAQNPEPYPTPNASQAALQFAQYCKRCAQEAAENQ